MSFSMSNHLIPRPVPEPIRLETIPNKPEVPEVSLVFDSMSRNISINRSSINVLGKENCENMNGIINNELKDSNNENIFQESNFLDSQKYAGFFAKPSSPLSSKPIEACHNTKKVSFSFQPYWEKSENTASHCQFAKSKQISESDNLKYCCGSDLDIQLPASTSKCINMSFKAQGQDHQFNTRRRVFDQKQSTCHNCSAVGEKFNNTEQNCITFDEFQKMKVEFENMFLKQNYMYSKMCENFVTRKELNLICLNYESHIATLLQQIRVLSGSEKKCESNIPVSPINNCGQLDDGKCRKCKCSDTSPSIYPNDCDNQTKPYKPMSSINQISSSVDCVDKFQERMAQYDELQTNNFRCTQKLNCNPLCFKQRCLEGSTEYAEKQYLREDNEYIAKTKSPLSSGYDCNTLEANISNDGNSSVTVELAEKNHTISSNHGENQKFKRMYENIVYDVKSMVEKNYNLNGDIDTINLIKKTTMEQFRKMGISAEMLLDIDRQSSSRNCKMTPNNGFGSSDLSLYMNTLAMKYVNTGLSDDKHQEQQTSGGNDGSIPSNCNNVSVATFEYMQRHQLLPASDQYLRKYQLNKPESMHNRFKDTDLENNDQSFIRLVE